MNEFSCMSCGSPLPKNAPADRKSVACAYCGQMNKNPNFTATHEPLTKAQVKALPQANTQTRQASGQVISLQQSAIASLLTGTTIIVGILLFIYFCFHPQNMWTYLACSVFVALPLFARYFVYASWENIAKEETAASHERYTVEYNCGDVEMYSYISSYIFFIWFAYLFFASFIPTTGENEINAVWCGSFAFFFSFAGVWFIDTVIQVVAEALGKWLPQE